MAYITKEKDTMNKEEVNRIAINKDLFAFASNFQDIYFANDLNWKKIAIHFKHTTSTQKRIVVLLQDSSEGLFEVSAMARTGAWQIEQIQVFDKDGGMEAIQRAGIPEATAMDISVIRKIAPSEIITNIAASTSVLTDYVPTALANGNLSSQGEVIVNLNSGWAAGLNLATFVGIAFSSQGGAGGALYLEQFVNGSWTEIQNYITSSDAVWSANNTVASNATAIRMRIVNNDSMNSMIYGSLSAQAMSAENQVLSVAAGKTTNFLVGYTVRVWDEVAMGYHDAVVYTITDVVGDTIKLNQDISNHSGKTLRLKFPSYADASANQKGIFQFIGTLF
jgi:hypothetical protein